MNGSALRLSAVPAWAWIFLLSVSVRGVLLAVWAANHSDFYRLGGEIGRVARSLAETGRFADPYMIPTGPTAHPAPAAPALLALIYWVFGYNAAAGVVRGAVGMASHALLYALLPWIAGRLGLARRAGVLAGFGCALWPVHGLGEALGIGVIAHSSLAFALLVVAFVGRWSRGGASRWSSVLLGVGCGAAFHVLPTLLPVVAGFLVFEAWRWRRGIAGCALVAATALLVCLPWCWRNYRELGALTFMRSNFGLELRIANHEGARADIDETLARQGTLRHPSENLAEARLVRELGEGEYNRRAAGEAVAWIGGHKLEFLRLTAGRAVYFWCGPLGSLWPAVFYTAVTVLALLGLRRRLPGLKEWQRAGLLIPLVAFPLVYYVVSYVAHYPAPLAWLLFLLAGDEIQSWLGGGR